jgi:lipoate-protein ligase A
VDTATIDDLEKKIAAVEKQLHVALGATHKADVNGGMKMVRVPSVHQISNYVESTRKRVKNIEDMEGTTKCAKFLQELQDSHEAHQTNSQPNTAIPPTKPTRKAAAP